MVEYYKKRVAIYEVILSAVKEQEKKLHKECGELLLSDENNSEKVITSLKFSKEVQEEVQTQLARLRELRDEAFRKDGGVVGEADNEVQG